jgi:hypothetical protein
MSVDRSKADLALGRIGAFYFRALGLPTRDARIVTYQRTGSGAGQGIRFELSAIRWRRDISLARRPVIQGVALGPANRVKNASRLAAALPPSPCLRSLRPIPAEHDPDHDHRAGCNHHRADRRQLFEDSENGCPPPMVSREAPACHTHSETPFGPSSEFLTTRSARQQSANSGAALRPHPHPCSGCCRTAGAI